MLTTILRYRSLLLALALLWSAAGRSAQGEDSAPIDESLARRAKMVARIDDLIEARLAAEKISPARRSSDGEFFRRVHLDLVGTLPRVADVRAFLASTDENKRHQVIDALVGSPLYATHQANQWRALMIPGGINLEEAQSVVGVQNWLRSRMAENLRYDNLVSELLVATSGDDQGPALYYTSLQLAPEKLAASTARIFLGIQMECAECHDHPFDTWKQTDFWGYAAFFAQLRRPEVDMPVAVQRQELVDVESGEVKLPNSETVVPPKFPGGSAPADDELGTRRMKLAIWMASRDNPYLARAATNRVWAQLFGRGLVEPADDLSPRNPPSHPELMDELTHYFVESGFDLAELFRTITRTRAYQRSSQWELPGDPPADELLARMNVRQLSAEQLFDAMSRVISRRNNGTNPFTGGTSELLDPQRMAFVAKMKSVGKNALEYESGVLQALTMMNGVDTQLVTGNDSPLLRGIELPLLADEARLDTIFLATLCREPSEEERAEYLKIVSQTSPSDRRQAWSDVLWSLMNSAEFTLNH